jgi:hypothetical protein
VKPTGIFYFLAYDCFTEKYLLLTLKRLERHCDAYFPMPPWGISSLRFAAMTGSR